jgi:hypothetical protein
MKIRIVKPEESEFFSTRFQVKVRTDVKIRRLYPELWNQELILQPGLKIQVIQIQKC